ncbi:hypothetical protein C8J55DRAFT_489434 [Lentinula edodes]|uniref:Uncharacterized protein n=1 Tax=Lentinula lateritia TaxID=40482 RepID=A0A9W9AE50_9AGAR|nr:hypothetical protein C8J55DRAFT_489434 [Lentinula edodes]
MLAGGVTNFSSEPGFRHIDNSQLIPCLPEFGIRIFPIQLLASAEEDSGRQTNAEVEFIPSTVLSRFEGPNLALMLNPVDIVNDSDKSTYQWDSRVGVDGNLPVAGQELSALEPDPCPDEIEVNEVKGCQMFGLKFGTDEVNTKLSTRKLLAGVVEEQKDAYEERKVSNFPAVHEHVFSQYGWMIVHFHRRRETLQYQSRGVR